MSGTERFAGRTAVVTGAASGIGRATVLRLAAEGAVVHAVDRDADGLAATLAALHDAGAGEDHVPVVADLGDPAIADRLPVLGGADVLVNAAGILRRHPVLDHPREDWEATLDVNLRGPRRLAAAFAAAHVAAGRPGAIVNVCSIESFTGAPAHVAYTVTKSALLMLTRSMAYELAPHGVRVNGIAPGVTATGMNAALREDAQRSAGLLSNIPMGRFGRPEDQAAAIAFLASDDAAYVTGAVLPVDGGWLTA